MLSFFKKLFGEKPVETVAEAPYKVDTPVNAPVEVKETATEAMVQSLPAKKPTAKKPANRKPRGPRKPKASK
jgi:hypothetical protein